MNQNFYRFGIFFLSLYVANSLLLDYIHLQLGDQMYFLEPFADWFLVMNIVYFFGLVYLLKYFYGKKYQFTFFTGTITALTAFTHSVILYLRLIFVEPGLDHYLLVSLIASLVTGAVFAISLVFSRASSKPWLKIAGVFATITNVALVSAIICSLLIKDVEMNAALSKCSQWISYLGILLPVFFIMQWRSELELLEAKAKKHGASQQNFLEGMIMVIGFILFGLNLHFGFSVAQASGWSLKWSIKGPERAKLLAKAFESRTYVNSRGDTMIYLLQLPLNYNPEKKYPLVVCLHGGPNTFDTRKVLPVEVPEPAPLLSKQVNREKYPAFLLLPQAPAGHCWGGIPNIPSVDSLVFEIIGNLEQEFSIDIKRRYVAGGSGGGYGSWYFIGTRPEMFAAAIPFCGAGDPKLAINMVDVPVWAFHGSKDRNVPVSGSREMVEAIKKAGGNPRYTEFPGVGHNVWPEVNATPGLLDWLFAQKRD